MSARLRFWLLAIPIALPVSPRMRRLWCRVFGHPLKLYHQAIFHGYWETYCPRCGERAWREP